MFNGIFKKTKYITVSKIDVSSENMNASLDVNDDNKPSIPSGMWVKCEKCFKILYKKDLKENLMVCPNCKSYFRMTADERINLIIDNDTFIEFDKEMKTTNPLNFDNYENKIKRLQTETGLNEAVITGRGSIDNNKVIIAVMDSRFMMASMGCVVGEKITRAIEKATSEKIPVVIFTASGGARMQEGIFSLMQMAKVSAALAKHSEARQLYVTVLTDPTTGGVTASFASLGDIILAEPNALIGFAGKRVIEQTIGQKLPEGFQTAEFLRNHGFIDDVISRDKLKSTLGTILALHQMATSSAGVPPIH